MSVQGTQTGSLQTIVNCAGITGQQSLSTLGSAAPPFGVVAPLAAAGTITGGTVTLGATATYAGTEKVGVFWTIAGVNYQRLGCTIAAGTGTSFALTGGSGTSLPTGGQAVTLATRQDVTDGVSILGDSLQQLIAKSTQAGAVEWISASGVERTSTIAAANEFDTWPTASGQTAPPSGWTTGHTVITIGFYNASSSSTATMQAGVILI